MKKMIKFLFAAVALTGVMVACGKDDKEPGDDPKGELVISVAPASSIIVNDGESVAVFTVMYDDVDVTSSAVIKKDGVALGDTEFTSTETGTFKFKAEYDGVTSNEVTVTVHPADELFMISDKTEIAMDDEDGVTFTVYFNGEDVTDETLICDASAVCLLANVFYPSETGEFVFEAKFEENPDDVPASNPITIIVLPAASAE